jgi:diguanylate cyclase (GGDEF)-like protein
MKPSIQPPPPEPAQAGTTPEIIDPATGLFSRPQFEAMLSKEFKKCLRFKQQMSCIMIDLDGRKMGRTADAALVKAIIGLVQNTIREVDTAAWWTGESLIVLLPQTLRGDAVQAAARVLEAVAVYPFTWPDATRVTMSIGVAGLPDKNIDSERKLIEAAAEMCKRALDMMVPVPESLRYEPRKWKPPASGTDKGKG